jgi:WD40 repeat protein
MTQQTLLLMLFLLAGFVRTTSVCAQTQPLFQVIEESLGKLLKMPELSARWASPDNRHFAYIASVGGKVVVVLDGKQGPQYDSVVKHTLSFSADSQRLVYAARRSGKLFLVLDQKEQSLDGDLTPPAFNRNPLLSSDGRHVACILKRNNNVVVLRDGVEGKPYEQIVSAAFSPDSQRFLYTAVKGQESFVVVDEVEGKPYRGVGLPLFSPDSRLVVYSARTDAGNLVVVNQKEGKVHEMLGDITISPDSKHVAYLGTNPQRFTMAVVDGIEGKPYEAIISAVKFSNDGRHVAYVASHTTHDAFVVVDGIEHEQYPFVTAPVFSPSSQGFAYRAHKPTGDVLVLNDVEGPTFKAIDPTSITFSPDSKHLAFKVVAGNKEFIVLDSVANKKYEQVGQPAFSRDNSHLAYMAQAANRWRIRIDTFASAPYDSVLNRDALMFAESGELYFIAIRNNEVFRVKCTPNGP